MALTKACYVFCGREVGVSVFGNSVPTSQNLLRSMDNCFKGVLRSIVALYTQGLMKLQPADKCADANCIAAQSFIRDDSPVPAVLPRTRSRALPSR